VNVNLGQDLVGMLCADAEELKRLDRGVGLPTTVNLYQSHFNAWPGSGAPKLSAMMAIHDNARSRTRIRNYQTVKTILYGLWSEIRTGVKGAELEALVRGLPSRLRAAGVE
jgi:hypothetical protein